MLFLIFHAGGDRYAIDATSAVEILPLVEWKRVSGKPAGIVGLFNYHGIPVPLIDLSSLMTNVPSRNWMSTRIIVITRAADTRVGKGLVGLLAEQVTEPRRMTDEDFGHSGISGESVPYLGRIAIQADGMIQRVHIENLIAGDALSQLFPEEADIQSATR